MESHTLIQSINMTAENMRNCHLNNSVKVKEQVFNQIKTNISYVVVKNPYSDIKALIIINFRFIKNYTTTKVLTGYNFYMEFKLV